MGERRPLRADGLVQEHLPEGRPPDDDTARLTLRLAVLALGLAAVATLLGAWLIGGWNALLIGAPAVLLYLAIGVIPVGAALRSRIRSKRRVRDRLSGSAG